MIEVNNLTDVAIDKDFIKRIVRKVLKGERKKISEFSVAFINEQKMKVLNRKYRKKNQATDVLAFQYDNLKEIVICPNVVKKNAERFGLNFKTELARIFIHGILHLLGYDHEKSKKEAIRMEKKQEYYLANFLNS